MSIYRILVINRAGSLIFDWEQGNTSTLSANEKIILSSIFHGLCTIATQLSPVPRSSGIETLETSQFRLQCFQSITGVKFIVIAALTAPSGAIDSLLRQLYKNYADFALKNPFYSVDMPIRADKFDEAVRNAVLLHEKQNPTISVHTM